MAGCALVDLHIHHALPLIGSFWRKRAQGLALAGIDGEARGDGTERIHGVAFYHTFAFGAAAARRRLFRSIDAFRRLPVKIILRKDDAGAQGGAYLLGVESLRYLRDPADLRLLWDRGARFLQPIHFLDTPLGRSSREGALPPSRAGLTGLGREMLAEMAALGFILDLAHMNRRTAEESLAAFPGPVMCSHTGPEGDGKNPRNLPSDLAREVFRRAGAVGVTLWRRLLPMGNAGVTERERWTKAFCDAALALGALAPDARVCVGSDRGAPIGAPAWFFSPDHLSEMERMLFCSGWNEGRVRGLWRDHALGFYRASLPA